MREIISTPNAPSSPLYSQGVRAGDHIAVSGLVGIDVATGKLAGASIGEQTRQALANCQAVIEAGGGTLDDVVEVGILLADPDDFQLMNEEYASWFPTNPPTRYAAKLGAVIPGVLISIPDDRDRRERVVMTWTTVAQLATALGTLVLAVATFASVRSGNRTARLSEQSLLETIRPLLLPSRLQDEEQKVGFADDHFIHVKGGHGAAEVTEKAIYLAIAIRNVGPGLAVLNAWQFYPGRSSESVDEPTVDDFHRLTRDLYIPPSDVGFWEGTFRDPEADDFADAKKVITDREAFTIDVLYGDAEGGQRVVSRFTLIPMDDGESWLASVSRHWNLDREDPRNRD